MRDAFRMQVTTLMPRQRPAAVTTAYAIAFAVVLGAGVMGSPAGVPALAANDSNQRSYDTQLMRLAEILGALHYLRELCDGKDGQRWRDAANELVKTEGNTALRKATIAQRFNLGYRGYRRTYRKCTPSARTTIDRFFKEAVEISENLVKLAD